MSSQFSLKQCAADTSTLQSKRDDNSFQYLPSYQSSLQYLPSHQSSTTFHPGLRKSCILGTGFPGTFCLPNIFSLAENDVNFGKNDGDFRKNGRNFCVLPGTIIQIPGLFTLFLRPDFISFATFKGYQVGRNLHVKSGMIGKWYCVDNIDGVIEAKVTVGVMRVAAHMK